MLVSDLSIFSVSSSIAAVNGLIYHMNLFSLHFFRIVVKSHEGPYFIEFTASMIHVGSRRS